MAEDPFLPFMKEVPEIGDALKEVFAEVEDLKRSENSWQITDVLDDFYLTSCLWDYSRVLVRSNIVHGDLGKYYVKICDFGLSSSSLEDLTSLSPEDLFSLYLEYLTSLVTSVVSEESLHIWGRRVADAIMANFIKMAPFHNFGTFTVQNGRSEIYTCPRCFRTPVLNSIPVLDGQNGTLSIRRHYTTILMKMPNSVVSPVVLLYFVYRYLIGYIDRGGSKAGSSGSLDFRDIYISIVLFLAAYVWIKFRDVIPRGAVYHRRDSNKWEPRIKFPVTRGVGGKSKRIPLGLYDTFVEGLVAYQIAAFYCKKRKHTGRLDLGGGAYFPIPALSLDPSLPYEEKLKQVGDQVLKVYAEFEEQKASRNLPPSVPGLPFVMPIAEGHLLPTSGMDSSMECQGSRLGPNTHNGVNLNNPGFLLLLHAETQHELLDAHKQIECLKAQVSRTEVESMGWEVKYSELDRKFSELVQKNSELEQRNAELEYGNGLLNRQIMQLQSPLQTQHEEQEFDTNRFLSMGHEDSLAR